MLDRGWEQGVARFKRGAYTTVREHFEASRNKAIWQEMMIMKQILEVVVKPQVGAVRAATVDFGARDDESAEFGAGIAVVAPEDIGTDFHVQILGNIPDRTGLQDSGRIFEIVDAR